MLLVGLCLTMMAVASCGKSGDKQASVTAAPTAALIQSESGGFALLPIPGYTVTEFEGGMTLYPDPFDQASGPGMVLSNTTLDADIDLDQAVNVAYKRYSAYAFEKPQTITIGGLPAVGLDFTTEYHADDGVILDYYGAEEGEAIHGRIVLVLRDPQTLFEVFMLAPEADWKDVLPLYEDVLESIQFLPGD